MRFFAPIPSPATTLAWANAGPKNSSRIAIQIPVGSKRTELGTRMAWRKHFADFLYAIGISKRPGSGAP